MAVKSANPKKEAQSPVAILDSIGCEKLTSLEKQTLIYLKGLPKPEGPELRFRIPISVTVNLIVPVKQVREAYDSLKGKGLITYTDKEEKAWDFSVAVLTPDGEKAAKAIKSIDRISHLEMLKSAGCADLNHVEKQMLIYLNKPADTAFAGMMPAGYPAVAAANLFPMNIEQVKRTFESLKETGLLEYAPESNMARDNSVGTLTEKGKAVAETLKALEELLSGTRRKF